MIEIQVLRMARVKKNFERINELVQAGTLDKHTKMLFNALKQYYKKFPDREGVDFTVFMPFVFNNVYTKLDDGEKKVLKNIMQNMASAYPDESTRKGIIKTLHETNLAHTALTAITAFNEGDDIEIAETIMHALDKYQLAVGVTNMNIVGDNIDDLLEDMGNQTGLRFRLECLNRGIRPIRGGDCIILAARPDQGKTSFMASELTYMAKQLPEGECILWLNNEGVGAHIRPRLMQAAIGVTTEGLIKLKNEGKLYEEYYKAVGGKDRIVIVDVHGYTTTQIEGIIKEFNPAVTVFDMMDNVQGFKNAERGDLRLEMLYQWGREKAVQYNTAVIYTSQISDDGKDEQYPGFSLLKDSRTGKQGACDLILMLGSMESQPETYRNTRWISAPKNKLRKVGSKTVQQQITFDRDRALFKEIEATE